MDATPILGKIKDDAAQKAAEILNDAKEKANVMRGKTAEQLNQMQKDNTLEIQRDSAAMEERMLRMAELEAKKSLLASRRDLLDKTFEKAVDFLRAMPEKEQKEFFLKQILSLACGDETIIPAERSNDLLDERFVLEANSRLKEAGKKGALRLTGSNIPGTGFVLEKDGIEINCTFEALIESNRVSLEAETARMLFSDDA